MTVPCIHKHNVGVTERLVVPNLGDSVLPCSDIFLCTDHTDAHLPHLRDQCDHGTVSPGGVFNHSQEVGVETERPRFVVVLQLLISEGVVLRILSGKVFLLADPVMTIFRQESGLKSCEDKSMILDTEQGQLVSHVVGSVLFTHLHPSPECSPHALAILRSDEKLPLPIHVEKFNQLNDLVSCHSYCRPLPEADQPLPGVPKGQAQAPPPPASVFFSFRVFLPFFGLFAAGPCLLDEGAGSVGRTGGRGSPPSLITLV